MRLLAGQTPLGGQPTDMIKLEILIGGGVWTFADDSGRPSIQIPTAGEILEVDRETGALLARDWQKFRIIPE